MRQNTQYMDMFFISYDEPEKEAFWLDLKANFPRAQRVDGIKGFDAAHKQCALLSNTSHLITVDGDCKVDLSFNNETPILFPNGVYSYSTKNHINGLTYGNGSLKIWPKDVILNMKTHEASDNSKSKIDFCWDIDYIQKNKVYSTTYPNSTPFQAFRAGFREAVKMGLEQGEKVNPVRLREELNSANYQRLLIWCNVGWDVANGPWAIEGARMGIWKLYMTDWDFSEIRDYEWFEYYWLNQDDVEPTEDLQRELNLPLCYMNTEASKFFKEVYINPVRTNFGQYKAEI